MHILYIEDDLVDQMMFKRLCKEVAPKASFTILSSIKELSREDLDQYYIIFSDIFLPDGDVNQILEMTQGREIILLSGETSPTFLESFIEHPYGKVFAKPLTKEVLADALSPKDKTEQESTDIREIDQDRYEAIKLANLLRLSKGDDQDMIELMDIALGLIPQRIEELSKGFEEKDWPQVHFSAHAAKSVSRLVGIPVYNKLDELDKKARKDQPDTEELFKLYQGLLPVLRKAYEELSEIKTLVQHNMG
ncbi:MAG: response regulator [Bacteroidota bacterium]